METEVEEPSLAYALDGARWTIMPSRTGTISRIRCSLRDLAMDRLNGSPVTVILMRTSLSAAISVAMMIGVVAVLEVGPSALAGEKGTKGDAGATDGTGGRSNGNGGA